MTVAIAGQLNFDDLLASVANAVPIPAPPTAAPVPADAPSLEPAPLDVEVVRSRRRRKTAEAQLSGSTVVVRIPAACTREEERQFVEHFVDKFQRSRRAAAVDLDRRAAELARRYDLPNPKSIRWVSNQRQQWGSCTPADGTIRLSDRMAGFPAWVIDYVIVHELAHLIEADHGSAFWALVDRYPKTERARGYLIAKDGG